MKAPGGCDNLKAQAVGRGRPDHHAAALGGENAEGVQNLKGGAACWRAIFSGAELFGKPVAQSSGSVLGHPL